MYEHNTIQQGFFFTKKSTTIISNELITKMSRIFESYGILRMIVRLPQKSSENTSGGLIFQL